MMKDSRLLSIDALLYFFGNLLSTRKQVITVFSIGKMKQKAKKSMYPMLLPLVGNTLDLDPSSFWERLHSHSRTGWLMSEVLPIDLIDCLKVGNIREKNRSFDDIVYLKTSVSEYIAHICDNLFTLFYEGSLYHCHGIGIERNLSREIEGISHSYGL